MYALSNECDYRMLLFVREQHPVFTPPGLFPAGNLHRFDIVRHIELAEIGDMLARSEGKFRPLEILIFISHHRGVGPDNDAFDVIAPVFAGQILQRRILFRPLQLDMRIVDIEVVILEDLDPAILVHDLHLYISGQYRQRTQRNGSKYVEIPSYDDIMMFPFFVTTLRAAFSLSQRTIRRPTEGRRAATK